MTEPRDVQPGVALRWAQSRAREAFFDAGGHSLDDTCRLVVERVLEGCSPVEIADAWNGLPTMGKDGRKNCEGWVWTREPPNRDGRMGDITHLDRFKIICSCGGRDVAVKRATRHLRKIGILTSIPRRDRGFSYRAFGVNVRALLALRNWFEDAELSAELRGRMNISGPHRPPVEGTTPAEVFADMYGYE